MLRGENVEGGNTIEGEKHERGGYTGGGDILEGGGVHMHI